MSSNLDHQSHPADKFVGLVFLLRSLLGTCGGLAAMGIGATAGLLRFVFGSPIIHAYHPGIFGGVLAVFGTVGIIANVLSLFGAIGVMQSRRAGFLVVLFFGSFHVLAAFLAFISTHNLVGLALAALAPLYCVLRLTGVIAPKVRY